MPDSDTGSADGREAGAGADRDTGSAAGSPDLAEETRRVVTAVQDWMRRAADRGNAEVGRPASGAHTGSDCDWCPICQFAAVVRSEHPELVEKVGEAGAAVAGALKAIVDAAMAHAPDPRPASRGAADRPRPRPRAERIDLDGEQ